MLRNLFLDLVVFGAVAILTKDCLLALKVVAIVSLTVFATRILVDFILRRFGIVERQTTATITYVDEDGNEKTEEINY